MRLFLFQYLDNFIDFVYYYFGRSFHCIFRLSVKKMFVQFPTNRFSFTLSSWKKNTCTNKAMKLLRFRILLEKSTWTLFFPSVSFSLILSFCIQMKFKKTVISCSSLKRFCRCLHIFRHICFKRRLYLVFLKIIQSKHVSTLFPQKGQLC